MHLLKKIFFVGLLQINGAQKIILWVRIFVRGLLTNPSGTAFLFSSLNSLSAFSARVSMLPSLTDRLFDPPRRRASTNSPAFANARVSLRMWEPKHQSLVLGHSIGEARYSAVPYFESLKMETNRSSGSRRTTIYLRDNGVCLPCHVPYLGGHRERSGHGSANFSRHPCHQFEVRE